MKVTHLTLNIKSFAQGQILLNEHSRSYKEYKVSDYLRFVLTPLSHPTIIFANVQ